MRKSPLLDSELVAASQELAIINKRRKVLRAKHGWEVLFWAKVNIRSTDECWPWTGMITRLGYGHVTRERGTRKAHRIAYELTNGPIAGDMVVCHACDNPRCCNPHHLWLGTQADNTRDAVSKGRMFTPILSRARGMRDGNAKLTDDDVREIVRSPRDHVQLAKQFHVCFKTIRNIRLGRTWRHVTGLSEVPVVRGGSGVRKRVVAAGVAYESLRAAALATGSTQLTIRNRIARCEPGYRFVGA